MKRERGRGWLEYETNSETGVVGREAIPTMVHLLYTQGGYTTYAHPVIPTQGGYTTLCTPCYTHKEAYTPYVHPLYTPREAILPYVHPCIYTQGGYTPVYTLYIHPEVYPG